jgi:hypothetical protein
MGDFGRVGDGIVSARGESRFPPPAPDIAADPTPPEVLWVARFSRDKAGARRHAAASRRRDGRPPPILTAGDDAGGLGDAEAGRTGPMALLLFGLLIVVLIGLAFTPWIGSVVAVPLLIVLVAVFASFRLAGRGRTPTDVVREEPTADLLGPGGADDPEALARPTRTRTGSQAR